MNFYQISILFLQGSLVAFVILLLFRLRRQLGIGILFACLGLFQFMQVFLSSTVYVTIAENFLVSPGSTVLFTASLFALLIIYIKEDASETKKIIYALLIVNIVMSILLQSFSWNFKDVSTFNPYNVSSNLFNNSAWVLFVGTVALFLDSLLIIILFEFISKHIRYLFLQICITMMIVVSFDTLFFSIIAFWKSDNLTTILFSGILSKSVFAIFYSIIFYFYLRSFDSKSVNSNIFKIKDVFQPLTFKQKFESATHDIKIAKKEIEIKNIRYKSITAISPVGIFQARNDGYTTFVNNRWSEITGVSNEKAYGWGWLDAVHPDDQQLIKQEWDFVLSQKRRSEVNYRFILHDGTIKWVLGQIVPEFDNQNQPIGFVGTITDITELKFFQEEQIILREKADESNRLKSAFLANMSHEIRTPMNGILGFIGLLNEPDLTETTKSEYIDIVNKSGQRLLNTINDIIEISKIDSKQITLHKTRFCITTLLRDLILFFQPEAQIKGYSIQCNVPENTIEIDSDKAKIESIFTNLIKNAIKFTDNGSITVSFEITANKLSISVTDTGMGIPEDKLETFFERFVMGDTNMTKLYEGSGLGLSITKEYVMFLNGSISVKSVLEQGTTFCVEFQKSELNITTD